MLEGYKTIQEISKEWELTPRQVQNLCATGKIPGVGKFGNTWAIPKDAEKPKDGRETTGQYKNWRKKKRIIHLGGINVMADTQITILGMSGSGKTCYLLGLYYKMGSGLKGYTITTDEDTDVQLRNRYTKLCDASLDKQERFPAGTDNISKYEFDLQYGYNTIMSFDWVDYPGGLLKEKNSGSLEEYEEVKKEINNSSSLFICVDGSLLRGDDIDCKIDNVRDKCSNVINTFFTDYLKNNNALPPTAIIVTKYDICKDDTGEEELCKIIEEAFSPFFVKNNTEKVVTIIPVSIGTNIMDDDYSGKMKPLNIHLPIFMGIWFVLSRKIQDHVKYMKEQQNESDKKIESARDEKAREENKWWFKSKSEVQRLARKIQEAENEKKKQSEQLNFMLNVMADDSDKLVKELEKIPYVFINGERSSFSELIQK